MTDNKQLRQVHDTSWDLVNSFRQTNQTIEDSVMAMQDCNLKFTQSVFSSWMELLTHQTESVQHFQQQWGQQVREQQDALQKLMPLSMQIYLDFLRTPFSSSRQLVDATKTATRSQRELVS